MVLRGSKILVNNKYVNAKFIGNYLKCHYNGTYASLPKITPREATEILRSNEFTKEFDSSNSIKYYDFNQLAANNPIEDARSEARCKLTNGLLFGVFDGHAGNECAKAISNRLFYYLAASFLPPTALDKILSSGDSSKELKNNLLDLYNGKIDFDSTIEKIYDESFMSFVKELSNKSSTYSSESDFQMDVAIENAFSSLDNDITNEALATLQKPDAAKTLGVAMSGAVAIVAHIDGPHLHVAGTGDCQAVLGVHTESDGWSAKMMNIVHTIDNRDEIKRILSEHPPKENKTVISFGRLLGQLAPFRAFGDVRYKWSEEMLKKVVVPHYGRVIAPYYRTPPYLTAKPDVIYHRLTPKDKFLIIASDGLWDEMSPLEAVRLVGEHMSGKVTLSPVKLPRKHMKLSEINEILLQRKEGLKKKPLDENAATHLLRNALGGREYGIDHAKLARSLSHPCGNARYFRDDITITVIYMDSEFLRHCPT
ncbi:hypothetical protein PV327_003304 [Microctonus hyperodae]|uniref:PPM-type phosphatase domain-containing protein n=1 Tax=Microctonus hyperodae TaxID=165561 RepID=A0AA39G438_MICHY|nr:hypothetical protein PV327_003304 [Microctonus hyperodae]